MRRGQYRYTKRTFMNGIDNRKRIQKSNDKFKAKSIEKAINEMKEMDINEKKKYIHNLQNTNYRYGTKYKYDCNLNLIEIRRILIAIGDKDLLDDYKVDTTGAYIFLIIIGFLLYALFVK